MKFLIYIYFFFQTWVFYPVYSSFRYNPFIVLILSFDDLWYFTRCELALRWVFISLEYLQLFLNSLLSNSSLCLSRFSVYIYTSVSFYVLIYKYCMYQNIYLSINIYNIYLACCSTFLLYILNVFFIYGVMIIYQIIYISFSIIQN